METKLLLFALFLVLDVSFVFCQYGDKILMSNVNALTLTRGAYTKGRRSAPILQLQCSGQACGSEYEPDVVQCLNKGIDSYGNPQWKCEAELDTSVRFGKISVSCEGYDYPDDPYILAGSCGLEYELHYTKAGQQQYHNNQNHYKNYNRYPNDYHSDSTSGGFGSFVVFVIFGIIIFGLLKQCTQNAGTTAYTNPSDGYGPGGPGYGGSNYGPTGYGGSNGPYGSGYYGGGSNGCNPIPPPTTSYYSNAGWRPGFWSGVGTGGLLGYFMRPRTSYYSRPSFGSGYSSGWSSPSSSSFSSGSTTRTSSSFGSTRRR